MKLIAIKEIGVYNCFAQAENQPPHKPTLEKPKELKFPTAPLTGIRNFLYIWTIIVLNILSRKIQRNEY